MSDYYPDHVPHDQDRFDQMLLIFRQCASKDELSRWAAMFTMDVSYPREDLLVALGRVERERGWH